MITLLIEFIIFIMDFFCCFNNEIKVLDKINNNDLLDLKLFLKEDFKKELNHEIEEDDFLKFFNEK